MNCLISLKDERSMHYQMIRLEKLDIRYTARSFAIVRAFHDILTFQIFKQERALKMEAKDLFLIAAVPLTYPGPQQNLPGLQPFVFSSAKICVLNHETF